MGIKRWRLEARQHNEDESIKRGERVKHQGRRMKIGQLSEFHRAGVPDLLANLFARAGLATHGIRP